MVEELNKKLENDAARRTEFLRNQNDKLYNYAFYNAHKVRGPLCRIMGIVNLMKADQVSEEYLSHLDLCSKELNEVVEKINLILKEEKEPHKFLN